MKNRIHFVISGLGTGGAEMMLYKLLKRIDRNIFVPEVVTLTGIKDLVPEFSAIDVPVTTLGMKPGIPDPRGIFKLVRVLRNANPRLVQTWMYHADLIGGIAARIAGRIPVVWNIRHSNLDPRSDKMTTILSAKSCARLSHLLPVKIVCCAEAAKRIHEAMGYAPAKMELIPNGFDLSAFKPDSGARMSVCQELDIPHDSLIIGLVARFHYQKDHGNFVRAASLLAARIPKVRFVLCGDGINWENEELVRLIETTNLQNSFYLLGRRTDMTRLTASFDIATSSSICGEAFPNTIGEAMACGVPCVVTDVGDSAFIVGDVGEVVPPGNPVALSDAWYKVAIIGEESRLELGQLARDRILNTFSLDLIVKRYENLYLNVINSSN